MTSKLETFWELVQQVGNAFNEPTYYKAAEPILVQILQLVQTNPNLQTEFEEAFATIMENTSNHSPLVVEFCMYVLRYPRIRDLAQTRLNAHPLKIDMHARHVLEAYQDDWKAAKLFRFFAKKSK